MLIISFLIIFFLKWSISQLPDLSKCELEDDIEEEEYWEGETTQ